MPFPLNILGPRNNQLLPTPRVSISHDDYDSSDSSDSTETPKSARRDHRDRGVYASSASTSLAQGASASYRGSSEFLLHPTYDSGRHSASSSTVPSPIPSRSGSPLPQFFSSAQSSSCTSDADSEPTSPLLPRTRRNRWWNDDSQRWWPVARDVRRRRRRKGPWYGSRSIKRILRIVLRHPLFPTQPTSILLCLLVLTIFAILLTLLLIHVLNPDKEPLPWRAYCSIPSVSSSPPSLGATSYSPGYPFNAMGPSELSSLSSLIPNTFPPPHLDEFSPAGVFLGVFSMDSAMERRMLVRSTWASHIRSRDGAGVGDGGNGTSRSIVRFIVGQPRSNWAKRVRLEAEMYNDIIVLPIAENMNSGKTHAFFSWAAENAWVPPVPEGYGANFTADYSYSNTTAPGPIPLAKHDPVSVRNEWSTTGEQRPWVRPDFVVKVDDDSFVMLAELEARLRVELHTKTRPSHDTVMVSQYTGREAHHGSSEEPGVHKPSTTDFSLNHTISSLSSSSGSQSNTRHDFREIDETSTPSTLNDPLVYWGYLVKNQFMAGELYALSWSLTTWVASDPVVKTMTRGKEDKQVAKWMRLHPYAQEVRWKSERCWIYDHPRAGTVYSHGFLFPSEVSRIKDSILSYLGSAPSLLGNPSPDSMPSPPPPPAPAPDAEDYSPTNWAHSSVSTFGVRYSPPLSNLTALEWVEALVEGSDMSRLKEGGEMKPEDAWMRREGRGKRYEGKRVGGTVVVHFIKKNAWYMETALAMLEGEEKTTYEKALEREMEEGGLRMHRSLRARRLR